MASTPWCWLASSPASSSGIGLRETVRGRRGGLDGDPQARIERAEFGADLGLQARRPATRVRPRGQRPAPRWRRLRAGWRCACCRPAVERRPSGRRSSGGLQHAAENADGVAAALVDVEAGVPALQAGDLHAPGGAGRARAGVRDLAARDGVDAAGAADAERALLFAVEVEEILATAAGPRGISEAPVSPVSSSMVKRNSSGPCATSSLSITASAAATPTPLSAPRVVPSAFSQSPSRTSPDRIGVEVVGRAFVLLADHVEVALQGGQDGALAAGAGGLADHDVADGVLDGFEAKPRRPGPARTRAPRPLCRKRAGWRESAAKCFQSGLGSRWSSAVLIDAPCSRSPPSYSAKRENVE